MESGISALLALVKDVDKQLRHVTVLTANQSSNDASSTAEEMQFLRERLLSLREQKKHLQEELLQAQIQEAESSHEAASTAEQKEFLWEKVLRLREKLLQAQIQEAESSYEAASTAEQKQFLWEKVLRLRERLLEARIEDVESSYAAESMAERKEFLRDKLLYLRDEKKSLQKYLWEEKKYQREKELEARIEDVESSYAAESMAERKEFLRDKLLYLRDEKKSLQEEKKYLWEEKKYLWEEKKYQREKELLELKSKVVLPDDTIISRLQRIENGMYASLWLTFWGELSSTVTSETTELFRTDLVTYYGDATDKRNVEAPEKPLRCMVTNLRLPGKWITAAHLLARKDKGKAHIFGIRDINDPRNGLLWFRAIEEAFSLFQIAFSWDADANTYLIHILDANLCNQKISELELRKKVNRSLDYYMDADTKRQFGSLTFADLEGKPIVFNNLNRPYKRVLSLHAKLAIHRAKLGEMLPPHLDLDKYNFDYWTEAADTKVLHKFLRDSQLWIDGKGLHEDEEEAEVDKEEAEVDTLSAASAD